MDFFSASLEIKTVDFASRTISAYAAAHHNIDRVRDIIDPQASVRAVSRIKDVSAIPVFVGHSEEQLPIGVPQKIEAHSRGLYTETMVKPGPAGDDLLHTARFMQQQGQPLGLSIAYRVRDSRHEVTARGRVRRILDYDLRHYCFASGAVTANPEAVTLGIKTSRKALAEGGDAAGGALVPPDMPCAACKAGNEADCQCPGCLAGADCDCCAILAREGQKTMQYRVDQADGKWSVYRDMDADGDADDNQLIGTYSSEETANAVATALRLAMRGDDEDGGDDDESSESVDMAGKTVPEQKAVWSTAMIDALPDSAFLMVEPGTKDSDGKTVPRSNRHLPIRDASGKVDLPHLRNAIQQIPKMTGIDDAKKSALQARARALLEKAGGGEGAKTAPDMDAPEWKTGSPLAVRAIAYRLLDLSEHLAEEYKAMALLGDDTKDFHRIRAPMRAQLAAVGKDLGDLLHHAQIIDAGDEGKARRDVLAKRLALAGI